MMVSMDRAGRIVIPKELRDRLELAAEWQFEIHVDSQGLHLVPVRDRGGDVVVMDDGLPAVVSSADLFTDADVRRWRDADQR